MCALPPIPNTPWACGPPLPSFPPDYDASRARICTVFVPPKKCFNPSADCCFPLVFTEKRAEGFDFPTLPHASAVQAAAQVRRWKDRSLRPDFQSADLARQKQGLAGPHR